MFKQAIKEYFNWTFIKLVLGAALGFGFIFAIDDALVPNGFGALLSRNEVFSYFNTIAAEVIDLKSTDFLDHLDDLEYLENLDGLENSNISKISKNSNWLQYYIVTRNSKQNTITVEQYGHRGEKLILVLSGDYKLISLSDNQLFLRIAYYWGFGLICSLIPFLIAIVLKEILVLVFKIIFKILGISIEITDPEVEESGQSLESNASEASEEDDEYCPEDYDEM